MSDSIKENLNKFVKELDLNQIKHNNLSDKRDMEIHLKIKNRNNWVMIGTVCTFLALIGFVVVYNVISGKNFTIDVATVLSTLLAFFSIFLSSFFYFKATDQSNQFYDRSYTHTRDIANTLSKMEGKFGEALKNIEEYSNRLNQRFDNLPLINNHVQENVLQEAQNNIKALLEEMQKGKISPDIVKQYEKNFTKIQQENEELKKELNKNKNNLTEEQKWNTVRAIKFYQDGIKQRIKGFINDYFQGKYFTLDEVEQEYYSITRDNLATSYIKEVVEEMLHKVELYVKEENGELFFILK